MNPCPCGFAGDPEKECTCSPGMVSKYQNRISGPILDRIDIHLDVPHMPIAKLPRSTAASHPARSARV